MTYEFTMRRTVEFAETDMAGIMHFSNYFRYMEAAEHAFFRSIGASVHTHEGDMMRGWVRVHADCDYAAPLRYQDQVAVQVLVREKRTKAIVYDFLFRNESGQTPDRVVARGSVTVVCVEKRDGDEDLRAVEMPLAIASTLEVTPPDVMNAIPRKGR